MDSETINKIKQWKDIEISDEEKYPSWFLECKGKECRTLRKKLGIKETISSNLN